MSPFKITRIRTADDTAPVCHAQFPANGGSILTLLVITDTDRANLLIVVTRREIQKLADFNAIQAVFFDQYHGGIPHAVFTQRLACFR